MLVMMTADLAKPESLSNKEFFEVWRQESVAAIEAVKAGADRQDVHEAVRQASFEAAASIKNGGENDLKDRLAKAPILSKVAGRLDEILDPARYVGRAPEQVDEFLAEEVDPVLAKYADLIGAEGEVRV